MQVSCNHVNKSVKVENRAKEVLVSPVNFGFLIHFSICVT